MPNLVIPADVRRARLTPSRDKPPAGVEIAFCDVGAVARRRMYRCPVCYGLCRYLYPLSDRWLCRNCWNWYSTRSHRAPIEIVDITVGASDPRAFARRPSSCPRCGQLLQQEPAFAYCRWGCARTFRIVGGSFTAQHDYEVTNGLTSAQSLTVGVFA